MLRSIAAILVTTALFGAAPAKAGGFNPSSYLQRQQQKALRKATNNDDLASRSTRNEDASRRLTRTDPTHAQTFRPRAESPFVRQSRANVTWDSRGLGLTTHVSAIGASHSIYSRLQASPMTIRDQLRLRTSGRTDSSFATHILHNSSVAMAANRFDFGAANERRREYRYDSSRKASLFMSLKQF